jgi:SAM-dependent methyltransferase
VALGKLPRERVRGFPVEARFLELLPGAAGPERRALIEALGKLGGSDAADAITSIVPETDFEMQLLDKAKLCLERYREQSTETDKVHLDVPLDEPFTLSLSFRRGLSRIVAAQLSPDIRTEPDSPTRLRVRNFRGTFAQVLRSRSVLVPAIELPVERATSDTEQVSRIVDVLTCEKVLRVLERLTSGRPRLRFAVLGEGHRRAFLWALSERLHHATSRISANPNHAHWEVRIDVGAEPRLFIEPHLFQDPRFTYRVNDISGASHPTIAAALAHLLGVRENDVIWDPFVGSGLELVERGLLGPYQELIGTDIDQAALDAAQLNVQKAELARVRLLPVDARNAAPRDLTGIVTNPPLGVRHIRDGHLADVLLGFLSNARRWLVPGGRLVWLSPMPARTAEHARTLGFHVERGGIVDVSGLSPELQVFRVPETSRSRWRS